jgi:hypothetical protein
MARFPEFGEFSAFLLQEEKSELLILIRLFYLTKDRKKEVNEFNVYVFIIDYNDRLTLKCI